MISIKACTVKLLKDKFDIDENVTQILFEEGILTEKACRDALIKDIYNNKIGTIKKIILKNTIAETFCVSLPTVEKIILNHF